MKKRLYIKENGINSRTDGKGVIFAHQITGENTEVYFVDRYQGPDKYDGKRFNRITVSTEFNDIGLRMTTKYKDTESKYALYVQYALDMLEDDTLEEYYKTILILTKISLESSVKNISESLAKYKANEYCWPITPENVKSYRNDFKRYKKVIESIDTTNADLKYFEQYEKEGVEFGDKRFDY